MVHPLQRTHCIAGTSAHPRYCTHRRAPTAWHPCGAASAEPPWCRTHRSAPTALHPLQHPSGCPRRASLGAQQVILHPATYPSSLQVPKSRGQLRAAKCGRAWGTPARAVCFAFEPHEPLAVLGGSQRGVSVPLPVEGVLCQRCPCEARGLGGRSPRVPGSTPLSVAQPRAQRGGYLRGPRCQGKAGLAPKLRVGFCSRWKGPRFRCCLASCSLLRGGGGCCGLVPGSREDAGAGLRAGRAPGAGWGAGGGPRARGLGAKPLVPLSRATLGHCPRVPPASWCPLGVACSSRGGKLSPGWSVLQGQPGVMSPSLRVPQLPGDAAHPHTWV